MLYPDQNAKKTDSTVIAGLVPTSDITIIIIRSIRGVYVGYVLVRTPKNIIIKTLMIVIIIITRK